MYLGLAQLRALIGIRIHLFLIFPVGRLILLIPLLRLLFRRLSARVFRGPGRLSIAVRLILRRRGERSASLAFSSVGRLKQVCTQ